jgi:hypothetical protein
MPLLSHRGNSNSNNIEYVDILIKEKQELQHSLNIEIQKRLIAERETQEHVEEKNRLAK